MNITSQQSTQHPSSSSITYAAGSSTNAVRLSGQYPPSGSYPNPPQFSYQSTNRGSDPSNIPSSVQAGLYEKRQRELQGQTSPQGSPTYAQSRHSEQLNYRYDDGPGVPLSQRQQQDQRHQQMQQQQQRRPEQNPQPQQQDQQHHLQRPQQQQMLPTPPGSFPPARSSNDHSETSQRSSGYPSPIEKQQPRRASGSNTAPFQGLPPPILPPYPMQRPSPDSMLPPPPPPLPPPSQPLLSHGGQPHFAQPQPRHQPSLVPVPVPVPVSAPVPSHVLPIPASHIPAPAPSSTLNHGTPSPLVLSAVDGMLAPMALGLQNLWKAHSEKVQMGMERMYSDFVLHLNKERKEKEELSIKVDELTKRLEAATTASEAASKTVQNLSSKLQVAERRAQDLGQLQDEMRRKNDCLIGVNQSLMRENSGLKRELAVVKETFHNASLFMNAVSDEYDKAKSDVDKTGLKTKIVANLMNHGHVTAAANVLDAVANDLPQEVLSPKTISRFETDKQVVIRFMNSVMGAVQDHLSRKMDGKMAAIVDGLMTEQSKRKAAEKALEEVLQSSSSSHGNSSLESTHNQVTPQSRAASPDPTQTTNPNPTPTRNQDRCHSQSLPPPPIQRHASVDFRQPTLSVDTHAYTYAHHRSNSFPQALSPSPHTLPQPPPPEEHRQRTERSSSLVSSTSTHVGNEAESDPKMASAVTRAESYQAETPNLNSNSRLPTPPPSRSKDNTSGNEDSDGDELMDWRPGGEVRDSETHMAGFASEPQREERRVPFVSSPLNKAPKEQARPSHSPPSVCEQTPCTSSQLQTPSQSPHLGKRSRKDYEADNIAREDERGRESSPVRMKLEPDVEEEEGRRSLSNNLDSSLRESVVGSALARYSSTASSSASAPAMSMSRTVSRSSGLEEGEVTPAPNTSKKKRSSPSDEGEIVEETPPSTPMSPPPIFLGGFRSRLHPQPNPQTAFRPPSRRPSQDQSPAASARHPPANPPAKLGINHLDLLYVDDGTSYTCRMCQTRRQQEFNKGRANKPMHVKKFASDAAWDDLVSHCYEDHPKACGELEKLSPSQVAERKQRMLAARAVPKR